MNKEVNSPIISSRHHDNTSGEDKRSNNDKNSTSNKPILIIIAIIILLMGLGAVFFALGPQEVKKQNEAEKQLLEVIEAN